MTLTTAILLCVLGIILLLVEVLFVPGVGVVGIFGFIALGIGIYGAYTVGTTEGHLTLGGSVICSGAVTWLAFRPGTWKRVSVNSNITGKMNLLPADLLKVGEEGTTTTRVNPVGNARFGNDYFEVTSQSSFIDENVAVEIVKIQGAHIYIKPKNP